MMVKSKYVNAFRTMFKYLTADKMQLRERPEDEPQYHHLSSEEFVRLLRSRHAEMLDRSEEEYASMSFEAIEEELGIEPGQWFPSPLDDRGGYWLETGLYDHQSVRERKELEKEVEEILKRY